MADTPAPWDPSNYVLASLAAGIVLLGLAGSTNTAIWVLLGLFWIGVGVALNLMNRPHGRP